MIDYAGLWRALTDWEAPLSPLIAARLAPDSHGDLPHWYDTLRQLTDITPSAVDLNADGLCVGTADDLTTMTPAQLTQLLMDFHPWRKGPFHLFGIHIDTEWRSDWKWNRLRGAIAPLAGRRVLDIGCGNGYYGWRMIGAGAALVLGVDPTLRYVMQYAALRRYLGDVPNYVLPLKLEELPAGTGDFDTVFSMGVIYHRRDPLEHLQRLYLQLRPGGELVLEGLVIEGDAGTVLHPAGRYAKMKNVHAIPSVATLTHWLSQAGFTDIKVVDVTPTTLAEQRRTAWMQFESLEDFLDPADPARTVEGHPAPLRAICTATRN